MVPARKAIPRRSAKRDNNRAGMIGMVNPNWAKMMTISGTVNPQNSMKCALPGPGFFRIFFWPRRYIKSPAQSPERFSSRPIRQTDHRFKKPTIIRTKAKAMRRRSKADIKISLPPLSKFSGKSKDIKPEPTQQKEPHENLVDGRCGKDTRLFLGVGSGMDVSHDRVPILYTNMTYITALFIERFFLAVGRITLMATQTIVLPIGLTEVLFFM